MRVGSGLSDERDPLAGAATAARAAAQGLGGAEADLVVVFASGAHLAAPEEMLAAVHAELAPAQLVGCGAGGVLGG
jgi:small ligand-binding sensory domain FIST